MLVVVGVEVGISVGVFVGGMGVTVIGTGVFVGWTGVLVCGIGVSVIEDIFSNSTLTSGVLELVNDSKSELVNKKNEKYQEKSNGNS